jgi:hypothetical protein
MYDMIVWYITISIEKKDACMNEWIIKLSERKKKITLSTMSEWLGLRLGRLRCSTSQPSGTFNGDRITICNSFSPEFVGLWMRCFFSIFISVFGDMLLLGTHSHSLSLSQSHTHSRTPSWNVRCSLQTGFHSILRMFGSQLERNVILPFKIDSSWSYHV